MFLLLLVVAFLSMECQKALGFHHKYLHLCSEDKRRSCRFETTWGWVINDRFFIFGWTIPLNSTWIVCSYTLETSQFIRITFMVSLFEAWKCGLPRHAFNGETKRFDYTFMCVLKINGSLERANRFGSTWGWVNNVLSYTIIFVCDI